MQVLAPTPENVARAAQRLRHGGLVGMPTETVYGLAADARNAGAVARVFAVKGRPSSHPLIVHLAEAEAVRGWAARPDERTWLLAEAFWPGPLTLVLASRPDVPGAVTGGQATVAVRVPGHPVARALLMEFDGVAAPSANRFGRVSPSTAAHVAEEFAGEDLIVLDGGPARVGLESTIVDLTGDQARVLRPGGVSVADLESVLGAPVRVGPGATLAAPPRVPGSLASHYAPSAPTSVVGPAELLAAGPATAVLALRPAPTGFDGAWLQLPDDPAGYGAGLYAALRALDGGRPLAILVERVPEGPEWLAVRDRLARASAPRPAQTAAPSAASWTEEVK